MAQYDYPIFSYFLQAYWNQTGDLVYGDVEKAAADFCVVETKEYRERLTLELNLALEQGLISDDMRWETYRGGWWSQFDVFINVQETRQILFELNKHSSS